MTSAGLTRPRSLHRQMMLVLPHRFSRTARFRRPPGPTERRRFGWFIAAFSFFFFLAVLYRAPLSSQDGPIQWYPALYEPNPDYIVVFVDLSRLQTNRYLTDVDLEVTFTAARGGARKEVFTFTDHQVPRLQAGFVHQRYFRHSQKNVEGVSGGELRYLPGIEGALPMAKPIRLPAAAPFRAADARLIGEVPGARAAREEEFQDWLGTYHFYEDGLGPVTLRVAASRRTCVRPPWCALIVTMADSRGNMTQMRLDHVDAVRMVFFEDDVSRDARTGRRNWKRYEAYMLRRDKSRVVGTVQFQQTEEKFGFYAERRD